MALSVLVVAESDSYLKWGVCLAGALPEATRTDVVIPLSPVRPSVAQRDAALRGTRFEGIAVEELGVRQIRRRVDTERPDVVVLAATGPTAHAVQEALAHAVHRPVLVAGIPGVALPARRKAWDYRGAVDLFVVHSFTELEQYDELRRRFGFTAKVGLATLPFLPQPRPPLPPGAAGHDGVVFATQGKVPRVRRERSEILRSLARLAADRPDLRVVVKTRGVQGEFHTHHEVHHYQEIWDDLVQRGEVPDAAAVGFVAGSMAEQLETAAALVTVSSTAALEAIALGVPLLVIDEFGVGDSLINRVFVGSGCMAGLDALERAEFRHPEPAWLRENYFHRPAEETWVAHLDELVARARAGLLPPIVAGLNPYRSLRRRRRDRIRLTRTGSWLVRARWRGRERYAQVRARRAVGAPRPPGAAVG